MAFTGIDVKEDVWSYIDEQPKDKDVLIALNEALNKLGDRALHYDEIEISAEAGVWYPLPEGLLAIVAVTDTRNADYKKWRERGEQISFQNPGAYTILYRAMPGALSDITDKVPAHDAFRPAIAHYIEGFMKLKDDDESADGKRLLAQAEVEFEQISRMLRRGRRSPNLTVKVER